MTSIYLHELILKRKALTFSLLLYFNRVCCLYFFGHLWPESPQLLSCKKLLHFICCILHRNFKFSFVKFNFLFKYGCALVQIFHFTYIEEDVWIFPELYLVEGKVGNSLLWIKYSWNFKEYGRQNHVLLKVN